MKKARGSKRSKGKRTIVPGGVDEYLEECPIDARKALEEIRSAIRSVAPEAIETVSYFDMPGYSYEGYPYNGMFVWFSFKAPFVRLHVRPFAIKRYSKEVGGFLKTKAVISFPCAEPIPKILVKKLVRASLSDMKEMIK